MHKIKAGIILANKYCSSGDRRFTGYINYIDRDNAVRNEHMEAFNLYQNYMENPEKSSGLFTEEQDYLSMEKKQALKKVFQKAQENGSLMWQPVISFDNQWLEENGLWDKENRILDESKIREFTRKSIGRMLKNENLEHAVWSASIHYNTDNIHIHVAVVEPVPMREKKLYKTYDYLPDPQGDYMRSKYGTYLRATTKNIKYYSESSAKYKRVERMDEKGKPIMQEGYVGRFKGKSIEACKSTFVNEILNEKEYGIQINSLIRESFVKRMKETEFSIDPELKEQFLKLHAAMPRSGNRGLWNYNSNIMQPLRPEIDALSDAYLEKYHPSEFKELQNLVIVRSTQYAKAYGNTNREYAENKMKDLHTRLGNVILKEIREYDKNMKGEDMSLIEGENSSHDSGNTIGVRVAKEAVRVKVKAAFQIDKAIYALKRSMDQEYEKTKAENLYEFEHLAETER